MLVKPLKTRLFCPPQDDLFSLIKESFSGLKLKEKSIFVFASKIISIWQGRCVKMDSVKDKDELIKKEADFYLARSEVPQRYVMLTLKNNILIPTAGIDESNGNGYFILWPEKPFVVAQKIYHFIKKNYHLRDLGIIMADSHCVPLRRGTMGISLAYWGFYPLRDYRGLKDIFGRKLKMSQTNLADSLATVATLAMGEGDERTPLAIIEDLDFIQFKDFDPRKSNPLEIDREEDIYAPLLKGVEWKEGGK
jgi:F420-0:gamma-glutamyl ligase